MDAALGGKDALAELIDVDVSGVTDNKLLAYDSASQKFIDQTAAEAGAAYYRRRGSDDSKDKRTAAALAAMNPTSLR